MFSRIRAGHALARETEVEAVPIVAIIHASSESPDETLVLPASVEAFEESPIFARTNGYLLRWNKDIGSKVKKGELLAEIDTPEIDQELMQARATRQQISAQFDIAKISSDRWQNLRKTDSVSQQEADMQTSSYQQAVANLAAADANVRRLEQMESFKHVYAPFSGVVTKRNVDPGALINAGSAGKPLFELAQVDPLRVFASVPQTYSQAIKVGMPAYPRASGIRRPEIHRHCRAHCGRHRSHYPHLNDGSRCSEHRRTIAPGLVRRAALQARDKCCQAHHSSQCHALPPGRPACRGRGSDSKIRLAANLRLAAITVPAWKSWAASPSKIASSSIPPDSLQEGQVVRISDETSGGKKS